MADDDTTRRTQSQQPGSRGQSTGGGPQPISWGAVLAGGLVALTVQLVLTLLGLAIGFGTIDPAREPGAGLAGLGAGVAWWWILTSLVSLFFGGWVAGRMAGASRRTGGALHGLVTWSLATALTVLLIGTGVGTIAAGLLGAVGHGAEALQGTLEAGDGGQEAARQEEEASGRALERIVEEARDILRASEVPELQPEELTERGEEVRNTVQQHLRDALLHPQQADEELRRAMEAVWGEAREVAAAADEEALANALAAETDLTAEEARQTVDRWTRTLEEARQRAEEASEQLADAAQQRASQAADALAWASFWSFLGLVLGACCAMGGGLLGARRA